MIGAIALFLKLIPKKVVAPLFFLIPKSGRLFTKANFPSAPIRAATPLLKLFSKKQSVTPLLKLFFFFKKAVTPFLKLIQKAVAPLLKLFPKSGCHLTKAILKKQSPVVLPFLECIWQGGFIFQKGGL